MPRSRLVPLRMLPAAPARRLRSGAGVSLRTLLGSGAKSDGDFLPADQAFVFSATSPARDRVRLRWDIADEYYLYRDKVKVTTPATGVQLGTTYDPRRRDQARRVLRRAGRFLRRNAWRTCRSSRAAGVTEVPLEVTYQGCADAGLCYPPLKKIDGDSAGRRRWRPRHARRGCRRVDRRRDAVRAGPARRQDPQRQPAGGAGDVFWRRPAARADALRAADGADPVRHHRRRRRRHARFARAAHSRCRSLTCSAWRLPIRWRAQLSLRQASRPRRFPETVDHRAVRRHSSSGSRSACSGCSTSRCPAWLQARAREHQQQAAAGHA